MGKVTGTLNWNRRILEKVVEEEDGWYGHGRTEAQFGFIHPWKVGPFNTEELARKSFEEAFPDGDS